MEKDEVFETLFFVLFVLMMLIRSYFGMQARRRKDSSWSISQEAIDREGRHVVYLRGLIFVFMMAVVVVMAIDPDWLDIFKFNLAPLLRWTGAVLSTMGLPLLVWVHHTLGVHWSTNLRLIREHDFVTSGPYRWVRHPMYTAIFIFFIGLSLLSANWLIIALAVVSIAFLWRRISLEEEMMKEAFEEYELYIRYTGRLMPKIMRSKNRVDRRK